jgi:hypothetical protein
MDQIEDVEIPGLDEIEDLQDDTPEQKPADVQKQLSEENKSLAEKADRAVSGYQKMQSERDQVVSQYSGIAYQLVQNGLAEYDSDTGSIKLKLPQNSGDSNSEPQSSEEITKIDSEIKSIKQQITEKRKEINKKYREGEITEDERDDLLTDEIGDLQDQRADLLTKKTAISLMQSNPKETKPTVDTSKDVRTQYDEIATKYPDSSNPESALFKEMKALVKAGKYDIRDVNIGKQDKFGNFIEFTGKPQERERLIMEAQARVDAKAETRKRNNAAAHSAAADAFSGPESGAYVDRGKKPTLDTSQVNMLYNSGFKSKNLIKEINSVYSGYEQTGSIILEG